MTEPQWRVRMSTAAIGDLEAILSWTEQAFGTRQAQAYRDLLVAALTAPLAGPDVPRSKSRDEIYPGLRTLHVGRPGRHFVLYRASESDVIEVVRILHDAMELKRHLPQGFDPQGPTNAPS